MKTLSLIILLTLPLTAIASSSSVLTLPSKSSSGCDLWPHFEVSDKKVFLSFYNNLKKAAKTGDKNKIKNFIAFPLKVNSNPKRVIKNEKQFLTEFDSIFTKKHLLLILNQDTKNFFCKSTGLMIGGGHIWINNFNTQEKFKISSINPIR
ncbi:MAG: hypothetical protein NXH75_07460 [Halobacteriovoraceae bacterium]|nr:hypothetical protein [Halobacteriovoraceae bacterium]